VRADVNDPHNLHDLLNKSDLVIHTVGTLLDSSILKGENPGSEGTYEHMNRDLLIRVADELQGNSTTRLVYVSASRGIPFIPRYLSTKLEAE
jgi:hypothetical protein